MEGMKLTSSNQQKFQGLYGHTIMMLCQTHTVTALLLCKLCARRKCKELGICSVNLNLEGKN